MRQVRSIFVSDLHLGCKYANAAALLYFLKEHQPDYLYLVGDVVDGWKLKKNWYWDDTYSAIIHRVMEMSQRGAKVYYTPGNHDEFLRSFIYNLGAIEISDEFIHETADNRRFLVLHGDQFDEVEKHAKWLSWIGDIGYELLLKLNKWLNAVRRRLGYNYWAFSADIKRRVKQFTSFISDFERVIVQHAADRGCQGIICGHIHTPGIVERNGVTYCNTGDWVESCSALVEYYDGAFEILHRPLGSVAPALAAQARSPAEETVIDGVLCPTTLFEEERELLEAINV